jgi:phosphotransferase system enzyme I (PtsP)
MSPIQFEVESREILDVYLLLANDPGWQRQLREKVQDGLSALDAVDRTMESIQEKFTKKGKQSLWHARIIDFEDLSFRLKRYLTGSTKSFERGKWDYPMILVADRIGPAELLEYDRERLAGLLLVEQSQTSHVAIVARSLEIPVVGGMKDFLCEINPGDSILVDGNEGYVFIRPPEEILRRYDTKTLRNKQRTRDLQGETMAGLFACTLDGVSISLQLNAGLVEDVDYIEAAGAEGVGLYRTEIPFMMQPKLPNVAEQTKLYREILNRSGTYPVVFRTLDVGGDKVLPYLERVKSENPSMVKRTTAAILDRPTLLRHQLRALIRASAGRELTLMLPMVAEVSQIKAARDVLEDEMAQESDKGKPIPTSIRLGAMIEVPSLVCQLSQLFPHVDFLSVGSNDLLQFFYGIDREHPKMSAQYDVLSPTFLSFLKLIQNQCEAAQIPLSICGEMAGRPLEALALIGLGYQTLSMSAASVPLVKNMIRSMTHIEVSDFVNDVCIPAQPSIRPQLLEYAKANGIVCD